MIVPISGICVFVFFNIEAVINSIINENVMLVTESRRLNCNMEFINCEKQCLHI